MNEFKINIFYTEKNDVSFQELINEIFSQYLQQKVKNTCNIIQKELTYY